MSADTVAAGLLLLQQEVPGSLVGKLPKVTCPDCRKKENHGQCGKHQKLRCQACDGWLTSAHTHLDYVGHAETTSKLLEADPLWNWEPLAFSADGLPAFDADGGLWIKLTVCGVTRLGYGTADNSNGFKSRGDMRKEIIGDALRNAAMRFGWALNLWAKTDIHDRTPQEEPAGEPQHAVADAIARKAQSEPAQSIIDEPSEKQMKMLHARLNKAHGRMTDEERYAFLSEQIGRPVVSARDLTKRDVSSLIDWLNSAKPKPQDPPDQDFHLPSQIGSEGICSGLVDAMAAAVDLSALTDLGKRVADLKAKGVLHEEHLGRLDAAWRTRQQELAVAA